MHRNTKIATCCYCGTQAALVLGRDRHELVCAGCGAPLSKLKNLQAEAPKTFERTPGREIGYGAKRGKAGRKAKKKRKPRFKDLLEDVFDELEDLFD